MRPLSRILSDALAAAAVGPGEAARLSGVHRVTISKCRAGGEREPDPATLARVLDALGYDVALVKTEHRSP